MAEARKVMILTRVDEATAKKGLEESGGDMTMTINKLFDMEVDVGAPVVKQVMLLCACILKTSRRLCIFHMFSRSPCSHTGLN